MTVINALDRAVAVDLDENIRRGIQKARLLGRPTLVSVSVPWDEPAGGASPIELFAWASKIASDRYYWSPPADALTLVGIGAAFTIELGVSHPADNSNSPSRFHRATIAWHELAAEAVIVGPEAVRGLGPILMGGFAFDARRPATTLWEGYPPGRLVLPKLSFAFLEDEAWLTYSVVVSALTDPEVQADHLTGLRDQIASHYRGNGRVAPQPRPTVLQRELRPAADWQMDVARAAEKIRAGQLEKVVLARAVELQATLPFDSARALRHLSQNYTGCYIFAIAHGSRCFLGATPERFIRLYDGEILTMSLAGSIRRGATPEEDERLGQALLDSAKDRYEHAVVVQAIIEDLDEVCASLNVSAQPSLLKLGNIQHICTTITGDLARGRTLFDLIECLHPTPAVGGRPREASLQLIRECEQLDRGWYAGPVGWVDAAGDGEFAVALRSALLHNHTATLFAGCGIMADSDPEREYAESILKLRPMLAALGL